MPSYSYLAVDTNGREVKGRVAATDRGGVIAVLQNRGLFPVEITPVGEGSRLGNGGRASVLSNGRASSLGATELGATRAGWRVGAGIVGAGIGHARVGRGGLAVLTTQLASLVSAGLPLDRCLEVLARQSKNPVVATILSSVLEDLKAGEHLSAALEHRNGVFPGFYVQMIKAGEASGQLEAVLTSLASYLEKDEARRAQIRSALTYPVFLLTIAVAAVVFIITFVIPRLTMIFADFGQELPVPTQALLAVSGWLARWGWLLVLTAGAAFMGVRRALRDDGVRLIVDSWRLRLPLLGPVLQKIVIARFARTFGTLVVGGVPLLDAMAIVEKSVGNAAVARVVGAAREKVREGEQVAKALEQEGEVFPPVAIDMIGVGEETGHLEAMLLKLADIYDSETDTSLKRLLSLLEPVIILGMGVVVGAIVISVLLPIFDLNASF